MAEFCKQCAEDLGLPENDFIDMCKEGEIIAALCEGCGPILVDHTGARVDEERSET